MNSFKRITASLESLKTPFYLYDKRKIAKSIQKLKDCFWEDNYKILYAMKANSNIVIIKLMGDAGFGIDACSNEEVRLSFLCGIKSKAIHYNADCMSPDEIDFAIRNKINLTIGSMDALTYVSNRYSDIKISIRINTGVGAGHSDKVITNGEYSKFGFHPSELDDVRILCDVSSLTICGLHTHTGSGDMDISGYINSARVLAVISSSFPLLEFLNFGGGFGFDYKNGDEYNIDGIHSFLNQLRSEFQISDDVNFIIEPGRYLVADSGVLISKISSIKYHPARSFIGLDTGYNHFARCFYYGAWHKIENITRSDSELTTYDVVGYLCQSGDVFARDRILPKSQVGDLICIQDVGAYGFSMSSGFNSRVKPGEYLLEEDGQIRMIRRPEKFEDIVSTFILD